MMSDNKQENEKRETVADIEAEYREDVEKMDRRVLYQPTTDYVRRLLDRIDAAWKRQEQCYLDKIRDAVNMIGHERFIAKHPPVGNTAAMREALREAIGETCAGCKRDCDDCMNLKSGWMKKAKAALVAPPRRCDVYAPDNAAHMIEVSYCSQMSPSHCDGTNCSRCSFKWFTSPAEEGGAK